MSPEEKSLLERTYKISEENNQILKSLRNSHRWSLAIKLLYWGVIVALSFGAYYFIQPYLKMMTGLYSDVSGKVDTMQNVTSKLNGFLQ